MIVGLEGGMGNQLFQLAFGVSVAARRKEELFFTKHRLDHDPNGRTYLLDRFAYDVRLVDKEEPPIIQDTFYFNQTVWTQGHSFVGWWQTEKYFNPKLVRETIQIRWLPCLQTMEMAREILKQPSAFLHVRRTDYLTPASRACHGNVGMAFYNHARAYILNRFPDVRFFVFSDDPEWCKGAFPECTVVDHNQAKPQEDLWLMSLCNHAVFPNSTFGWWGAWLGDEQPNRIVIGPKRWFVIGQNSSDVIPERWLKFDNLDG